MEQRKNPKICLLGATFKTTNMGVSALTAGIIKSILCQLPNAEITILDYGKEGSIYDYSIANHTIRIRLLNLRFSKKFYLKNNIAVLILLSMITKVIPFQQIRKIIISKNPYLNQIYKSDIVASIAGGDSFSDIYGIRWFFYYSLPQLLVLFLNKDLILLPQTIGPFKRKLVRLIARYILDHAAVVYSRDYTGLKEVKDFVENKFSSKKYKFCYDVGFVIDSVKPNKFDLGDLFEKRSEDTIVVGLNASGLLFMDEESKRNIFGLKIIYKDLIYDIIDFMLQKPNVIILLVPHVFGAEETTESDMVVCEHIYSKLKDRYNNKIFLARGNYDQHEIKYIIGYCDFFIGSRMHACIAALSQNIPTVSIAYSKKFFGVMESIGFESLVADPRKIRKKPILQIINDAFECRDELSNELSQKMRKVKKLVLGIFRDPNVF